MTITFTPPGNIFDTIERQLPDWMRPKVTITVDSDPYYILAKVTFALKHRTDFQIKTKLGRDLRIPDTTLAELVLYV